MALTKVTGSGADGLTLSSTDVTVASGDLLFGTADKGVVLGVTSNTASNTISDYEEGSFSPTFSQSGATVSMSSSVGFYTKIGRVVHASGRLQSGSVSGGSAVISIAGLPFTSNTSSAAHSATIGVTFSGWSSTNGPSVGFIQGGADKIELYKFDSSDARDQRDTPVTSFGDGSVGAIFNVVYTSAS